MKRTERIIETGYNEGSQLAFIFPAKVENVKFLDAFYNVLGPQPVDRQLAFPFMNPWHGIGEVLSVTIREMLMRESFARRILNVRPLFQVTVR